MTSGVILFVVPTLLFVLAFLYETFLSLKRIGSPKAGRSGYVKSTWEITHTLLVVAVVMLVMMFTQDLVGLASAIFLSTFIAAVFLGLRAVLYIYIFYVRKDAKTNWIDLVFALTHVFAALFLVVTAIRALIFLYQNHPVANTQFLPYFIPGMVVTLVICALPLLVVYSEKN